MTDDKRKPGRPAKAPEDKLQVVPVRLNAAQKETLQVIGQQALRDWLDKGGTHMRRLDYQGNFTGPDAALIAAAPELLAAAKKVNALSIQSDAHKELRAAIAKATEHDA